MEQELPALAAVRSAIDATIGARRPARALRGDIYDIIVFRVHNHARDLARVLETNALPGSPRVGALVHTVAPRRRLAAHGVLAHADVHDVGIVVRDRDRAHAPHAKAA